MKINEIFNQQKIIYYYIIIFIFWLGIFSIRLFAPSDLMDNDQERPAAYVLDILKNGNWLCQRDDTGDITSKPPLYSWISALFTLPFGRISLFTLYLPSALSILGITLLLFNFTSKFFDLKTGFITAIIFLVSPPSIKNIALARTDALFSFTVFVAAVLIYKSLTSSEKYWFLFWLFSALSTLTKGPLGILLSSTGLIIYFFHKPRPKFKIFNHYFFIGAIIFISLTISWFIAAYSKMGEDLINKMISKELVGHAVTSGKGYLPFTRFYIPPFYFITRFFPWSIIAILGIYSFFKFREENDSKHFYIKYFMCYFLFGLLIFCLVPHQRADHLLPLIPAACIIAGIELTRFKFITNNNFLKIVFIIYFIFSIITLIYYHQIKKENKVIKETNLVREYAKITENKFGKNFPFVYVDAPFSFQFFLNSMHKRVDTDLAAEVLKSDYPAYVVVKKGKTLRAIKEKLEKPVYTISKYPEDKSVLKIVSNFDSLQYSKKLITTYQDVIIKMENLRWLKISDNKLTFSATQEHCKLELINKSSKNKEIVLEIKIPNKDTLKIIILKPEEIFRLTY